MKTIILSLFVISTSLLGQNFKTATHYTYSPTGWGKTIKEMNSLTPTGAIKQLTTYTYNPNTTGGWDDLSQITHTLTSSETIQESLRMVYTGSSWKQDMRLTNIYTGTQLTSATTQTASGSSLADYGRRLFNYDQAGKLSEVTDELYQSGAWKSVFVTSYERNSSGAVKSFTVQQFVGSALNPVSRTTYTYNNGVTIVLVENFGSVWYSVTRETTTYNTNNQIASILRENWNDNFSKWENNETLTYKYSGAVLNEILTQAWGGSAWENSKMVQFTYDNPVGISEYSASEGSDPVYYDLQGNRIEKRYNEVMVEVKGTQRRKVIVQQ